jgi:hypothetical protein
MNRLQLVQRAARESGGLVSAPSSTVSQTGGAAKLVERVDEAWTRIQGSRNWDWMWQAATVTILATTGATAGSIPASRYVKDTATDSLGAPITYLPWAQFRLAYPAPLIAAGNPRVWTIRPDKAFAVNAKPAADTAFSVERYRNPTAMALDADVPTGLPDEHHLLIVWRALQLYAGAEEDVSLYKHATVEYRRVLAAMGVTDGEEIAFGGGW